MNKKELIKQLILLQEKINNDLHVINMRFDIIYKIIEDEDEEKLNERQ